MAIWALDEQGNKISKLSSRTTCQITSGNEPSIRLFSNCEVGAVSPGKVNLAVEYYLSDDEILSTVASLEIVPKKINSTNYSFSMSEWQPELWLVYPDLVSQNYYRASIKGQLAPATALDVIPSRLSMEKICRNTVPVNANKVACYFQAQENDVTLVINKPVQAAITGQLQVEPAHPPEDYDVAYTEANAKPLQAGLPVSSFVFANEMGTNNSHYYWFDLSPDSQQSLKVSLQDFTYPVALNISWANGVCTEKMLHISPEQIYCVLPKHATGRVKIEIEGNNGVERLNAPAAQAGGSRYTLLLEYR